MCIRLLRQALRLVAKVNVATLPIPTTEVTYVVAKDIVATLPTPPTAVIFCEKYKMLGSTTEKQKPTFYKT